MSKKHKKHRSKKKHHEAAQATDEAKWSILGLLSQVTTVAQQAREISERINGIPGGRRNILRDLWGEQGMTVPRLAQSRGVSRQHIQMVVNPMIDEGLIELVHNPNHKRSNLLRLTESGERLAKTVIEREEKLHRQLEGEFSGKELRITGEVLERLTELLAGELDEKPRAEKIHADEPKPEPLLEPETETGREDESHDQPLEPRSPEVQSETD